MDPKLKAKWIEALRSGKYKQGKGNLCHKGYYCCLGVLCELLKNRPKFIKYVNPYMKNVSYGGLFAELSVDQCEIIGINYNSTRKLITMNDDIGNSFEEIADWIEENL